MLEVKSKEEVDRVCSDILPRLSECYISALLEAMDENKYLKFDPLALVAFDLRYWI